MWGFDGSSTQQADGSSWTAAAQADRNFPGRTRTNGFLVMCEALNPDGTPHPSNARATIAEDEGLAGLEQEYFLQQDGRLLGWPNGYRPPGRVLPRRWLHQRDIARQIVEEHLDICLAAGINHEGINGVVAKGQWEFQIFGKGAYKACDQVWVARYILPPCEKYGIDVEWHCKPVLGDWNGSGMHCNFSTAYMRETGGKEYFLKLMDKFEEYKDEHIVAYGPDNHLRLTGLHETQSIDKFSWGVADRGASIRVPHSFVKDDAYMGYPRTVARTHRRPLQDCFPRFQDSCRSRSRLQVSCDPHYAKPSITLSTPPDTGWRFLVHESMRFLIDASATHFMFLTSFVEGH